MQEDLSRPMCRKTWNFHAVRFLWILVLSLNSNCKKTFTDVNLEIYATKYSCIQPQTISYINYAEITKYYKLVDYKMVDPDLSDQTRRSTELQLVD